MPGTPPTADELPSKLLSRDHWVCWRTQRRNGNVTKVPVDPATVNFASTSKPETWASFDRARERAEGDDSLGIGFVFTKEDPVVGVDLDDCRNPETDVADEDARDIIDQLGSYTEVSPSGTGFHVLALGSLPDGRCRRGNVEMYEGGRFFTVTGDHDPSTPKALVPASDALSTVHDIYITPDERDQDETSAQDSAVSTDAGDAVDTTTEQSDSSDPSAASPPASETGSSLTDETLLEKAKNADNGEKFRQLWNGLTSGYESHSEADMALCAILAFWTGNDSTQMDRLFRQSGLMREKWGEVHYGDGSTYGERTIERAIEHCSAVYEPSQSGTDDDAPAPSSTTPAHANATRSPPDPPSTGVIATDPPTSSESTGHQIPACDAAPGDQTDTSPDHLARLVAELETAMERIDELETELERERSQRNKLEDERIEASESDRWWWPF